MNISIETPQRPMICITCKKEFIGDVNSPDTCPSCTVAAAREKLNAKPVSSYCPPFNLIPLSALICLAKRYELGAKKYGSHSWISNMEKIGVDYVIERLNHVVYHCLKLIGKLEGRIPWDGDDDAGAILWGGACAAEAFKRLPELQNVNVDPERDV